ncbi:MAG: bifunctional hydroxymethylpyrimidine kinase/phosphomethylpyrimidine kinase [Planctomycetes bacterium]|nr:bifunctional hydroxymethylpyrimidine kinase/phosphomethylpyrimidine kinase [Planctomycetota bacterium]
MNSPLRRRRLLVVAGHDPSGAGVTADRAAVSGLDIDVEFVTTAHTLQDAGGVRAIGAVDPDQWSQAARAHAESRIDAVKFGLLPGAQHVSAATQLVNELRARFGADLPVVVDPVLAASSGTRFVDEECVEMLRGELFGAHVIAAPNIDEAAELAHLPRRRLVDSCAARAEAAGILLGLGLAAVVIKGGHGNEDPVRDLLVEAGRRGIEIEHARLEGASIRGSGCRFATHLAARLAMGETLESAARHAVGHVAAALAASGAR